MGIEDQDTDAKKVTYKAADYWLNASRIADERFYANRRWLLASQLTISSGAIISLLNIENIDDNSRLFALIWYFSSILGLFIYSHFEGRVLLWQAHERSQVAENYLEVAVTNKPESHVRASYIQYAISEANKYQRIASVFFYLPFLCLITASVIVVEGIK
ncbi:MAG: hypothetical protein AAF494_13685 [Pseudomonadota bacterium]